MPSISPAINIGIGNYGGICMEDLATNFCLREEPYKDFVTFHQLNEIDGTLTMHNYDSANQNFYKFTLASQDEIAKSQNLKAWELHNFISQAYNRLITLTNQLQLNVNYHAIHINLIFAAYEIEHLELLKETILLTDKLKKQGDIGEVRIKCFSILSDGIGVSSAINEENIFKTLNSLVEIRDNYDILSHNFILDDKNTKAVSLNVKNNYLAFAISEIIVALIRNEYAILGALSNPIGVVSIGMGLVYFDIHFFNAFIKNKILESKIEIEKIHRGETKISTTEYVDLVQNTLVPYVENKLDVVSVIEKVNEVINPNEFGNTLGCYEFLIANLLGQYERVSLVKPIDADELYSVDDLIYHNLYNYVLTSEEKKEKGILNLKDHKKKLTEYNAKIRDDVDSSTNEMVEEKGLIDEHEKEVDKIIKYYSNKIWRKKINFSHLTDPIEKQIEEEKTSQSNEAEKFNKKNIFIKFFSKKKFDNGIQISEKRIGELNKQLSDLQSNVSKIKEEIDRLYELKSSLENVVKTLDRGINQMHLLKEQYQKTLRELPYLDYEFIQNIISIEKLNKYEKKHRENLQEPLKGVLTIMYNDKIKAKGSFINIIDDKITEITNSIIDFKMTKHLLNEYDDMELLKSFNFTGDLKKLKQSSYPFFNAIPTYSHYSHYLKYFNNDDEQKTSDLEDLLEENYTGSLPSTIHSESTHKFALITFEVIKDLKSIVKYNNHSLRIN